MARSNEVTIYSNGIADFRRVYSLVAGAPREITLAVKRDHVGDVLASLCVFGDVRIPSPPSFPPSNQEDGQLTLDANNVLEDLARQLVGATVTATRPAGVVRGTLMGLHAESEATGGERVRVRYLVLRGDAGLIKIPVRDVQQLHFEDEIIRGEIDKALSRSLNEVQPDATQLQLILETDQPQTEAVLQYTVPAAAWKICYRLREDASGAVRLQGLAVVDNNTEEDWQDCVISVVTGDPITFSTDLAEAKTPRRQHVDVVRDEAEGAIELSEALPAAPHGISRNRSPAPAASVDSMLASYVDFEPEPLQEAAWQMDTESREVGVYTVYRSLQPLSVGSRRSILFPVFETDCDDCRFVLYYKRERNPERPYRAVRFRHAGPQGLGRGVCTVFQRGAYAGSCVIPVTKPGEQRLLPHALESGVRVACRAESPEQTLARIFFSEGACHTSWRWKQRTIYRLQSSSDEAHRLVLDHRESAPQAELEIRWKSDAAEHWTPLPTADLLRMAEGYRMELDLPARVMLTLEVTETRIQQAQVDLVGNLNVDWLRHHVVRTNGPLANDPAIRECLRLQGEIRRQQRQLEQIQRQVSQLETRQDRLRKNIQVGGQDEQTGKWRIELGQAEDEIHRLQERETAEVEDRRAELERQLREALGNLSARWQEA